MDVWQHMPTTLQETRSTHPLTALEEDNSPHRTVLRTNPLYSEEDQDIIVIVDTLDETKQENEIAQDPSRPRRAPSTSSGYGSSGSGGGSHGRSTPYKETNQTYDDSLENNSKVSDVDTPLSKSLQEDIRSVLHPNYGPDVQNVLAVASIGAVGVDAIRARLQAALAALPFEIQTPVLKDEKPLPRAPSLPYVGPGVRPGDVIMMPKQSDMSMLAASALFTLDAAKGEALARRLAKGRRRRRQCRAIVSLCILIMLLAAVGAVELLLSRGTRMFGAVLR